MIDSFTGRYRFLSNFYPVPVFYDGCNYPSVEHAFQAMKTLDRNARLRIAMLATPGQAKRAGRRVELRADWEKVKVRVMLDLLRQKFSRDPLRGMLRETEGQELIEGNTWGDTFWGQCAGVGENHLGRLLERVRSEINRAG